MNEELMKKSYGELVNSTAAALGIVCAALARQIDPVKFHSELKLQIDTAKQFPSIPPLAIHLATEALAAVEAEKMLQKKTKH